MTDVASYRAALQAILDLKDTPHPGILDDLMDAARNLGRARAIARAALQWPTRPEPATTYTMDGGIPVLTVRGHRHPLTWQDAQQLAESLLYDVKQYAPDLVANAQARRKA